MISDDPHKKKEAEARMKKVHLQLYDPHKITSFIKAPIIRNGGGRAKGYKVPKIWLFNPTGRNKKEAWKISDNNLIKNCSTQPGQDGNTEKYVYVLLKHRSATWATTGLSLNINSLYDISIILNCEIYGISISLKDKMCKDWIPLENVLEERLNELLTDKCVIKYENTNINGEYLIDYVLSHIWKTIKPAWKTDIKDKKSSLYVYLETCEEVFSIKEKTDEIEKLFRLLNNFKKFYDMRLKRQQMATKKIDIKSLYLKAKKDYPLLCALNSWEISDQRTALIDYINLLDKSRAKQQAPQVVIANVIQVSP